MWGSTWTLPEVHAPHKGTLKAQATISSGQPSLKVTHTSMQQPRTCRQPWRLRAHSAGHREQTHHLLRLQSPLREKWERAVSNTCLEGRPGQTSRVQAFWSLKHTPERERRAAGCWGTSRTRFGMCVYTPAETLAGRGPRPTQHTHNSRPVYRGLRQSLKQRTRLAPPHSPVHITPTASHLSLPPIPGPLRPWQPWVPNSKKLAP